MVQGQVCSLRCSSHSTSVDCWQINIILVSVGMDQKHSSVGERHGARPGLLVAMLHLRSLLKARTVGAAPRAAVTYAAAAPAVTSITSAVTYQSAGNWCAPSTATTLSSTHSIRLRTRGEPRAPHHCDTQVTKRSQGFAVFSIALPALRRFRSDMFTLSTPSEVIHARQDRPKDWRLVNDTSKDQRFSWPGGSPSDIPSCSSL